MTRRNCSKPTKIWAWGGSLHKFCRWLQETDANSMKWKPNGPFDGWQSILNQLHQARSAHALPASTKHWTYPQRTPWLREECVASDLCLHWLFFLECSHVCIFRISSTLEKKDQVLLSLDLLECQLDIVVGDSVLFRFWVHKNWLTLKAGQNLMAFILISIINRLVCLQKLHDLIWGHVHTRRIELSVVFAPLLVRCFNNRLWLSWTKSCKLDCRFVALLTACFEPCHDKNASPLQKRGFRPFIYKKLSGCRLLLLFA